MSGTLRKKEKNEYVGNTKDKTKVCVIDQVICQRLALSV